MRLDTHLPATPAARRRARRDRAAVDGRSARRLLTTLATAVALLAAVVAGIATSAPAGAQSSAANDWLQRINGFRASKGLSQLTVDGELTGLAQQRAQANANAGNLSHTPSLAAGLSAPWTKLGENVGVGPNHDMVWNAFINSPAHLANLVDPAFTHIGIGVANVGAVEFTAHRFMAVGAAAPSPPAANNAPIIVQSPAPRATTPTTRRQPTNAAPTTTAAPAPSTTAAPPAPADGSTDGGTDADANAGDDGGPPSSDRVAATISALGFLD